MCVSPFSKASVQNTQSSDEQLARYAGHACRHTCTSSGHVFVNAFKYLPDQYNGVSVLTFI